MEEHSINRRQFFRLTFAKGQEKVTEIIAQKIKERLGKSPLRPPGALSEALFLLSCTKCGKCTDACTYNAINICDEGSGIDTGTPYMAPQVSACVYCVDKPCIAACDAGALRFGAMEQMRIGIAKINVEHCLIKQGQHCDYCFRSCPREIKAISKSSDGVPVIDESTCVGCGKCSYICVSQTGIAIEIVKK